VRCIKTAIPSSKKATQPNGYCAGALNEIKGLIQVMTNDKYKTRIPQILLYIDDMIAEQTELNRRGLEQLRQRFVEEWLEITLEGKPHGHRPKVLGGEDEVRLIALVCSPKPDGHTHWSLRLLADAWKNIGVYRRENIIA